MNTHPITYVVCYDVANDRRRRSVYELLREHGDHVQYSVFRCALSDVQRARLEAALLEAISVREDQVLFIRLGKQGSRREWPVTALGKPVADVSRSVRII